MFETNFVRSLTNSFICSSRSFGFGSKVSMCEGPPSINRNIQALALAGRCGGFGASPSNADFGLRIAELADASRASKDESATPPRPIAVLNRKSRRDSREGALIIYIVSISVRRGARPRGQAYETAVLITVSALNNSARVDAHRAALVNVNKLIRIKQRQADFGQRPRLRRNLRRVQVVLVTAPVLIFREAKRLATEFAGDRRDGGGARNQRRWIVGAMMRRHRGQMRQSFLFFPSLRLALKRELERQFDPPGAILRHRFQSLCKSQRDVRRKAAVEKAEDLWRDGAGAAKFARLVQVRAVEDFDERVDQTSLLKGVNRAAIAF